MKLRLGLLLWITALPTLGAGTALGGTPPSVASPVASPTVSPSVSPRAGQGEAAPVKMVAQLTGAASINDTEAKYGVTGTDLGHTFEHEGTLYMVLSLIHI